MKCAGVSVLYNPSMEDINNINSYIANLDKLYLVDNSNKDNSSMIPSSSKIEYVPFMENMGIGYALNYAAKHAIELGYDWLLTMDQDSQFDKKGMDEIISFIESDSDIDNIGIYTPFHYTAISGEPPKEKVSSPLVVMTSGNFVNLSIYEKIGGFKDWLFIDCVDFDYCLNLRSNGFDIKQINSVKLSHELGDYETKYFLGKKFRCDNHNPIRRYYIVRNSFYINDMYRDKYPDYCKSVINSVKRAFIKVPLMEKDGISKVKKMVQGYRDFKKGKTGRIE